MSATEFLPFATDGGANVMDQADWDVLAARDVGFSSGIAKSEEFNKAWRQATFVGAALTQAIVDRLDENVLDNGDLSALIAQIKTAFAAPTSEKAGRIFARPATAASTGELKLIGNLVSRTTHAALWTYAQASGNISTSDGAWLPGQFSPGDGANTFRIPDYRAMTIVGLDDGAGIDVGRAIGSFQANAYPAHTHSLGTNGVREVSPPNTSGFSGTVGLGNTITDTGSTGSGTRVLVDNIAAIWCITTGA